MLFRVSSLASLVAMLGCGGPLGVLPGGRLSGESAAAPAVWDSVGNSGQIQLETRPEDPYSVNINYTVLDEQMYANAGDTETQWVKNLAADPRARIRLDGRIYPVRAERVTDPGEMARFGKVWTSQGRFYRDPSELDPAFVYRLMPR
jgi:hypothetical protein